MIAEYWENIFDELHKYVAKNTSYQDADDLCEDIAVALLRREKKLAKYSLKDYRAYTFGIARNIIKQWYRDKKPGHKGMEMQNVDDHIYFLENPETDDPGMRIIENEEKAQLWVAISSLAPIDRELIELRHLDELSFKEISRRMGVSVPSLKMRHARVLGRLKKIFTE